MSDKLIELSSGAADKVLELITDDGDFELNLRVAISGGGCSGFQYGFSFDEKIGDDDYVVETTGSYKDSSADIKLLVDPISFQYLQGAKVDYQKSLQGEQFVVLNPNANTTCGCGSSFSV